MQCTYSSCVAYFDLHMDCCSAPRVEHAELCSLLSVTTITHVRANEPLCISYIDLYKSIESSLPMAHAHTLARNDSYATKARRHARTHILRLAAGKLTAFAHTAY
jgi:hypothetical protein